MNGSIPESENAGVEVDLHGGGCVCEGKSESKYPNVCLCANRLEIHFITHTHTHTQI